VDAEDAWSAELKRLLATPDPDPLALDGDTAERLLDGDLSLDQAPPGTYLIPSVTLPRGSSRPGPTRHPTLVGSRPHMPERRMLAAQPQMARVQEPPANQGRRR